MSRPCRGILAPGGRKGDSLVQGGACSLRNRKASGAGAAEAGGEGGHEIRGGGGCSRSSGLVVLGQDLDFLKEVEGSFEDFPKQDHKVGLTLKNQSGCC